MTLREQPQALTRLSAEARTNARNEAGKMYASRLRSTIFVEALVLTAIWISTTYPSDHYNVLAAVSILLGLGSVLKVLAISARERIWSQSSNRWFGMISIATLMTAGGLGFLLVHAIANYGFGDANSTMVMIWNTAAVASSIVNLPSNTRIFRLQAGVLLLPALAFSLSVHSPFALHYASANAALFLFSIWQGRQVNADFWAQLASRFLEEQRAKEIDSARRTAEQALSGARSARSRAEQAAKARSEFLANMSHEIRTPMNAVMGMTSLILDQNLPPDTIDCVNTIRFSSDALLTIINDILDFSKIESGKLDLEDAPFCLHDCIEEVLELLANRAAEKKLELAARIDPNLSEWVMGDITRTRQILLNLVGNAVKFTQYGEVSVLVTHSKRDDGIQMLNLAVRDTGIGIPPDKLDSLFQSFRQVDSSTSRRFGGTGLGLAISKRLTELMGGKIWVTSQPDIGSVFQFEIPYRPAPAQTSPQVPKDWQRKRVLVVDGHEINRLSITSYLKSWSLTARAVSTAQAALDALRAQHWDAILLDWQLPEMDGPQFVQAAKREFGAAVPPVILLSASAAAKQALSADAGTIKAVLPMPVRRHHLQRTLDHVLDGISEKQTAASAKIFDTDFAKRAPLRILLAEDNPVNQKVAVRMLERLGYRLDAVANGLEVLDALHRQAYDVVLMDVQMPEMNGLDATRRIISAWGADRPWITALTAGAMKENRDECLDAGVDDFLTKPINVPELEQALTRCFDHLKTKENREVPVTQMETVDV